MRRWLLWLDGSRAGQRPIGAVSAANWRETGIIRGFFPMFDLNGRKALVTGASGGIGEAVARVLHAQGATVGLHGTRREKLETLAADLSERVKVLPADLSDRAEV